LQWHGRQHYHFHIYGNNCRLTEYNLPEKADCILQKIAFIWRKHGAKSNLPQTKKSTTSNNKATYYDKRKSLKDPVTKRE
jgi:hypothetical protein